MILLSLAGDEDLVGLGSACGSGGDLAVSIEGVAGLLEEGNCCLESCVVLLLVVHAGVKDVVAVGIDRVCCTVALVSRLRSCPRGVGDGVLDNCGTVAVVGVDNGVTVDCQNGHEALTESLGLLGAGVAVDVDEVSIDA